MSKIQSDLEAKLAVESNKLHKMKDQVNYFLKELQKNQYALDDRVKILESQQIHQDPVQTIASLQEILSANVTKVRSELQARNMQTRNNIKNLMKRVNDLTQSMANVNSTLTSITSIHGKHIQDNKNQGDQLAVLVVQLLQKQKAADMTINQVSAKIEDQIKQLNLYKNEAFYLGKSFTTAQQKISRILQIQESQKLDRDQIARNIQARNAEIGRIDVTLQNEKQHLASLDTRVTSVRDDYQKMMKTVEDLSSKMDSVEAFTESVSNNRADIKSMNSAIEAMARLENDQEDIQNGLLTTSEQVEILSQEAKVSRKELSDRLENAIAEMTGKNQKIERDVDDLRREELKAITSLTQRTEAIDEKVRDIEVSDHRTLVKRLESQISSLRVEKDRLKRRLEGLVEKVDPILLLLGSNPHQRIRQICQEEMARYGLIDSYSRNRG